MPTSSPQRVPSKPVLVVGTTSDYIDILCRRFPGQAIFLTDARERAKAKELAPAQASEALTDLTCLEKAVSDLLAHLDRWRISLSGITCFDCESMRLASDIAAKLSLPYPSSNAVTASRSKIESKRLWQEAALPCPDSALVQNPNDAVRFLNRVRGSIILKPLTGSGSELVFRCSNAEECAAALGVMRFRLAEHHDIRMYVTGDPRTQSPDPRRTFAAEEFIEGTEYSCDFIVERGQADIIRMTRKISDRGNTIGTILAYVLPSSLPPEMDAGAFRRQLAEAARSLGIQRAICMLDFIVRHGKAHMLEMTPRPGGDCLPPLILQSCGLDMLGLALDFAAQRPIRIPEPVQWKPLVGVRIFARQAGIVRRIDAGDVRADPRVLEVHLEREPGHQVILPPADYDTRLLGHIIFKPSRMGDLEAECREVLEKLIVEIET